MENRSKIAKSVWNAEEAEKLAVTYTLRKFPIVPTDSAQTFHAQKSEHPDKGFQINHILANRTGIAEMQRVSMEERVEKEALTRLQTLQESAYKEAYELGLQEGRDKAFREQSTAIEAQIDDFAALMTGLQTLKTDLVTFNETHLIKTIYQMAAKIAVSELEQHPELVGEVLKKAIADAQSEEKLTVHVSTHDLAFLTAYQEREAKNIEVLTKVKLLEDPRITRGGCVVETNYGVVDATIEQRVARLWVAIGEKTPKVKDTIEAAGSAPENVDE